MINNKERYLGLDRTIIPFLEIPHDNLDRHHGDVFENKNGYILQYIEDWGYKGFQLDYGDQDYFLPHSETHTEFKNVTAEKRKHEI